MRIIKNFSKTIQLVLHISIFVLILLVFIYGLSRQLFTGQEDATRSFETWQNEISYSLKGLFRFSSDFVALSAKNTPYNIEYTITEASIIAAKNLKIFIILIFVLEGLYLFLLAFKFRFYSTVATILSLLVIFIVFKHFAISNFTDLGLITAVTKSYKSIIALISISLFISSLSLAFDIYLKKSK